MPSANSDKLKGQRLGIQRFIERLVEKLQDNDDLQFEPTIAAIETQLEIIKSLNEKIISLADAESTPDELLDSQMYVFDTEAKLRRYRQNLRDHPPSSRAAVHERSHPPFELQPPAISEASENVNQSSLPEVRAFHQPRQVATYISITQPPHQSTHFHQLPKLSLPTFYGDVLTWQAFWDSYESAIHLNGSLTDVQKFNYLKTMVDGVAARTIEGFALTNANYGQAVALLTERYGQKHRIAAYMNTLLQLPSPPATLQGLRRFYDQLETNLRGLE